MSTLLEQASLVLIPSGYKEDVVYSQIPTNGSGDLSFTRASNGTRINSAGLVEVCPWNLLEQSEAFSNTSIWNVLNGASVSANTAVAPNGTTTADTLTFSANASSNVYCFPSAPIGKINVSVYAKTASGTKEFALRVDLPGGTTSPNFTATTEWQRFDFEVTTTVANLVFYIINGSSATAGSIFIWGAQLNIGSTAKPYFPTTDRLNVPRLTYQNGGGGCPSLLLEKQSTNVLTYSEQFDNAAWTKTNTTITANSAISPDGTTSADTVANTGTANTPELFQLYSGASSSTVYTLSCFMKANTHTKGVLRAYNGGSTTTPLALFDLSAGTIIATYGNATNVTINAMGNGWYRCSMTFTTVASTVGIYAHITNLSNTYTYQSGFNYIENYNNTGSIYIYGAQLEASSYPTSYIPSTSASATRVADACSKTGISSLIGQTQGTILWDLQVDQLLSSENILNIDNGSFGNTIYFLKTTSGGITVEVYVGGTAQCSLSYSLPSVGRYKIAFAYASNDFALYVNGVARGTGSSGSVPPTSRLQMGQGALGSSDGQVNELLLFPTRLTNAELASLTTI
jgi:hypothetical protein